ncbi:Bug family tripartite tricarboxylate transporter substrate binding protein [Ottowia sp. VDI28]|uniref:Bug family tripartite tricarboxylate transporter substrate binding protein n=1 Tax=Ottowia sp. VDI28 TaxID=3133968 RepID=UPI003C2DF4B5
MVHRRHLLAMGALGALPSVIRAEATDTTDWPKRPVKVILGFPAGQGSDVLARILSDELQKKFNQPFVVDNRPGAGATLAARDVARSAPDGYSLLFTSSGPLTVAPHLYSNLGFDPMKDLEPVGLVGRSPLILLVKADSPFKTLPDLVAAAKKKEFNCGSGGNGVTNHLAMEMFKATSGTKLVHVPYKGAAPALTDLIGGQIDTLFETTSAAMTHVKAGRLRALAVSSPTRYFDLPEVPAVAEFYPGFDAMTWAAFAVPRGTPRLLLEKLSLQLMKLQDDASVREKMIQSGVEPTPGSTQAKAKAYVMAEHQKWGDIIRRANIKLE